MAILDTVKSDLGISSSAKDTDISLAIESCKRKMAIQGVDIIDDTDELTITAIKLFCRGWFNFQGDAQIYNDAFDKLTDALSLSGEYRVE